MDGIVSIDLYASDTDVYFSEFTFTRNLCRTDSSPKVVDALLYFIDHKLIDTAQVTAEFVEQTLADRSWVQVALDSNDDGRFPHTPSLLTTQSYPSSFDLCKSRNATIAEKKRCLRLVDPIQQYPLHCVASKNGGLSAIGIWKDDRFRRILAKIDWLLAAGLAGIWIVCKLTGKGDAQPRHQIWNCFLYLTIVVLYKWQQDSTHGLVAPNSLWTTVYESWQAFTVVHPVSSPAIALSHMATYWVSVAALRSQSLQSMVFYWFCYEVATSFINEYYHFGEEDNGVHCARVTFIAAAKHYAMNDVVRIYFMPPFLVYGYLLPKMVLHWFGA
jgi:hypothetical protein